MDRRLSRVFVDKLSSRTKKHELEHMFEKYGRINSVSLNRGNAYVEFDRPKDATEAIRKLDDTKLHGKRMSVEYAVKTTNNFLKQRKDEYEDDRLSGRCFKCKEKGHIARNCDKVEEPEKKSESKEKRRHRSRSSSRDNKSAKSDSSSKERRSHSSGSSSSKSKSKRGSSKSSKGSEKSKKSAN